MESTKIEMQNNGKIDLLTQLQTPSAFLRNIRKTIATVERGLLKPELAIVTIRLNASYGESEIKELSECIGLSIRDSDYFTRMSERGFWLVLHGNEIECEIVIKRIRNRGGKKFSSIRTNVLTRIVGEKRDDWILRVDDSYFSGS